MVKKIILFCIIFFSAIYFLYLKYYEGSPKLVSSSLPINIDLSTQQREVYKNFLNVNFQDISKIKDLREDYEIAPLLNKPNNKKQFIEIKEWRCDLTDLKIRLDGRVEGECRHSANALVTIISFISVSNNNQEKFLVGNKINVSGRINFLYIYPTKDVSMIMDLSNAVIRK